MAQLNANLPYIECKIRRQSAGITSGGFIFGCKAMLNRPLLFHFQTNSGAVIWNRPISAFYHGNIYEKMSEDEEKRLSLLESWDCQSNNVAVTCFKFLEGKMVDVICRDGVWRSGTYLFTVDDYEEEPNAINVGYANDIDSKCFHFIKLNNGNFCVQPNNLLRWHNADYIIPYAKNSPPKIVLDNSNYSSERIDRTYGNSAYFYHH
jgi:hypothetical protein